MKKIKFFTVGKIREHFFSKGIEEYEKRLRPHLQIEWIQAKGNDALAKILNPPYYCFDMNGQRLDSPSFSKKLIQLLEKHSHTLQLVIGGPDGIPASILQKQEASFSLSQMTFTNQMCRLIAMEQIYRAIQIELGTKYHK